MEYTGTLLRWVGCFSRVAGLFFSARLVPFVRVFAILLLSISVSAQESGSFGSSGFFSSEITYVKIPKTMEVKVLRTIDFALNKATASQICKLSKAVVCINASFFDENNKPLGLLITRGLALQNLHAGGNTLTGIFAKTKDGFFISGRKNLSLKSALEAIQAGPRLFSKGNLVEGVHPLSSRKQSGVCVDKQGDAVFYLVRSGIFGTSLEWLSDQFKKLDCVEALNLDGGGSSQMYIEGGASIEGDYSVPIFLGVFAGL